VTALLAATGISAGYGKKTVVHTVDLALQPREILVVLGHNGAGKTTLLRTIFGLIRARSGTVTFDARDITGRSPSDNIADGLALVPQGHGIFRTLSVRQNLELGGFSVTDRALLTERMQQVFALFPVLAERQQQIGGTLSGGQQQMLAIGMALMSGPRLLILDEPSIGLAPSAGGTRHGKHSRDQRILRHRDPPRGTEPEARACDCPTCHGAEQGREGV
jgi:branched-chain amino acid transport system ATP-binding protein